MLSAREGLDLSHLRGTQQWRQIFHCELQFLAPANIVIKNNPTKKFAIFFIKFIIIRISAQFSANAI